MSRTPIDAYFYLAWVFFFLAATMSADAMLRAILMDVRNVCTKTCVCLFFSFSSVCLSYYSFIRIVCPIGLPLLLWTANTAKYYSFSSVVSPSSHRIIRRIYCQPNCFYSTTTGKSQSVLWNASNMRAYIIHISMIMCYCPWHITAIYAYIHRSVSLCSLFHLIRIALTLHANTDYRNIRRLWELPFNRNWNERAELCTQADPAPSHFYLS